MEEGKRTKVRHEPTMCAQEEEATIPPGWLFDQLKQYLITRDEFIDYYREISPSIDTDEYFAEMMRSAWKL